LTGDVLLNANYFASSVPELLHTILV
jgi:hypothetical protein